MSFKTTANASENFFHVAPYSCRWSLAMRLVHLSPQPRFDTCFAASLGYQRRVANASVICLNFLHLSGLEHDISEFLVLYMLKAKKVFLHNFLLRLIQFPLSYLHYFLQVINNVLA